MKLHIPLSIRKFLMFSAIACTVQANTRGEEVSCGNVEIEFPAAEEPVVEREGDTGGKPMLLDYVYGAAAMGEADSTLTKDDCGDGSYYRNRQRFSAAGVDSQRALDALLDTVDALDGVGVGEDVIYVERRGKGVVRRSRQGYEWYMAVWNDEADQFGGHTNTYDYFWDGNVAIWVGSKHKIYYNPAVWSPGVPTAPAAAAATTATGGGFGGGAAAGGGYGGGGAGGYTPAQPAVSNTPKLLNKAAGATLTVKGASTSLTGNWVLDLGRAVVLDYSAASAPLTLGKATLNIKGGDGLVLDLAGRWDGESGGVFDLVSLGSKGTLKFNGGAMKEDVDYLASLGEVTVRYTDADGKTATLKLSEVEEGSGLTYALKMQGGTLSFVVSEPAKTTGLFIGQNAISLAAAALPMPSAEDPGESGDPEPPASFTWTAGQEDFTWAEGSAWGDQGAYTTGSDATFTDNGDDTTDTQNVTVGGHVTASSLTVSGADTYNFSLGDNNVTATDFTKTGSGTLNITSDTGSVNAETVTISGGSVTTNAAVNATSGITVAGDAENSVSFTTTGAVATPSIRVDGASMSVNQAVTGLQSLTLANGATMNNAGNSAITFVPGTTLRVEGQTHSTLTGDWTIDASKHFVLDFSAEYTSSLNIASGTLTITGTRSATNVDNALILDLGAKWDGEGDFSREIFSVGSAGRIVVDGAEIASGDQISLFSHLYLRYKDQTGTVHTIDLSGAGNETSADLHYGLDWSGTSLTFSVVHTSEDAQTPFVWQHGYGNLTWKEGGAWRGTNYTSTGSNNVLFKSDGDTTKDIVTVTINGTVAPGDIGNGVAGIRVMGDDNFTFQGTNNASIANYTTEVDGEQVVIATTLTKTGSGTLTIKDNVSLDYTGRTEVLGGTMYVQFHNTNTTGTVHRWTPSGTVVVGINGTLKMGSGTTSLQDDVIWLGDSLFENDGVVITNILKTTGTEIAGRGQWQAAFMLLEQTNFEAGSVTIQDTTAKGSNKGVLANAGTNGSMVLNGSEGVVY